MTLLAPRSYRRTPEEQKEVTDAIDDLRDYTTDSITGARSEEANATLYALNKLYRENLVPAVMPAIRGIEQLRRRNRDTVGQDIPINHVPVYKNLRDVLDVLDSCLYRDFHKEIKQGWAK